MSRSAAFILSLILPLGGCATADRAAVQAQAMVQATASPTLSTQDAAFMDRAARFGVEAVAFGQLARTQGNHAAVRDYGFRTVDGHTSLNQELTRLAEAEHITLPLDMDPEHQQRYAALAALPGRAFDRDYLNGQATDQEDAIALFRDEAARGTDPRVRAFAGRAVPQLEAYLNQAERLGGRPTPGPEAG